MSLIVPTTVKKGAAFEVNKKHQLLKAAQRRLQRKHIRRSLRHGAKSTNKGEGGNEQRDEGGGGTDQRRDFEIKKTFATTHRVEYQIKSSKSPTLHTGFAPFFLTKSLTHAKTNCVHSLLALRERWMTLLPALFIAVSVTLRLQCVSLRSSGQQTASCTA